MQHGQQPALITFVEMALDPHQACSIRPNVGGDYTVCKAPVDEWGYRGGWVLQRKVKKPLVQRFLGSMGRLESSFYELRREVT